MGFFASLKRGWTFMSAAFQMAAANRKLLAPSVYLVLTSILHLVAWVAALVSLEPELSDGQWTALGAVYSFLSFLIFYFFCGMTVNMVDVHIKGGQPSLAEGARDAAKNFFAITFLALISAIVDTIARAVRRNGGLIGKIVIGLIEAVWTTFTFLLLPAIIIEDASLGQAIRRVRDIHSKNLLLVGIGEVGVRAVTFLIGFVATFLISGLVYVILGAFPGQTGAIVALVVAVSAFSLFAAFNVYLRMAYYTCLYVWAAEVEAANGQRVKAPGPLGVALADVFA